MQGISRARFLGMAAAVGGTAVLGPVQGGLAREEFGLGAADGVEGQDVVEG
ncbi:hypothetical protein [Streptomyces sp. NBC_00996]|uniref:hypothetical protein n=1 Tax=Streptomyces sp. NBC_00996 TaxID=2903710 RepID=UPI00386B9B24|nr:hypothetical protein OG390_30020 [Streptomyces sp. NBC_00996]